MKRRKKILRISIALIVIVFLLGCSGTVCAKGFDKEKGEFTISYLADAEPDSGEPKKITKVEVDEGVYMNCQLDEKWPDCKEGAPDVPQAPINEPYVPKQYRDNEKKKIVCVQSVSMPRVTITNSWKIGIVGPETADPAVQGIYQECASALSGQKAWLKSEHHNKPSSLMCTIWVMIEGNKKIIAWRMTQALGDCYVEATIP